MYWYNNNGTEQDVFVSTRVRFARNLNDYPFEPILTDAAAKEIIEKVRGALMPEGYVETDMSGTRDVLCESHLISYDMAEKKTPCALFEKDDVHIMVCEEDHLRIQAIRAGLDLEGALEAAGAAENKLDEKLSFAFDQKLGYLTHCPTNLGTAMRASVMMFLPCLTMTKRMKGFENQLSKLGLTVRGTDGEGSNARGCLYQISNCVTLGITEEEIVSNLKSAAMSIAAAERELKGKINEQQGDALRDRIMRSVGIAKYAYMMTSEELFKLYSDIRLGAALGIIDKPLCEIDTMLFENLPAHISERVGKELSPAERDKARAKSISEII